MAKVEIKPTNGKVKATSVWIDVDQVTDEQISQIANDLKTRIESEAQISNAFADSFIFAIKLCPLANPSDVWQHLIYRTVLDLGYSDQQWKRISGFALERAFAKLYQPILQPFGLRIRPLPKKEAQEVLEKLGFKGEIKKDKIDCIVEKESSEGVWTLFAGLHVKASLAERIQDDVPASLALMSKSILSIVITMDSKSYPPPHGNGVNYGELGGRSFEKDDGKYRIKRQYIEDDGQFSGLFSFNLRTPPSEENTASGKRIFTLRFLEEQPDAFVKMLLDHIEMQSSVITARE